jgi:CrcB protein
MPNTFHWSTITWLRPSLALTGVSPNPEEELIAAGFRLVCSHSSCQDVNEVYTNVLLSKSLSPIPTCILPAQSNHFDASDGVRSSMDYLWIGLGGFAGANARVLLSNAIANRIHSTFPYGTWVVNISGSLLIGVILTLLTEKWIADPAWRLVIVVGFLGGYTTFSSYSFQAIELIEIGQPLRALTYVLSSNIVGLVACYAGFELTRRWLG